MGVTFQVSKTGTRFCPKPVQPDSTVEEDGAGVNPKEIGRNESTSTSTKKLEVDVTKGEEDVTMPESEVSFMLNLFPDCYSIGNPSEATLQDCQKFIHPYDRTSETLLSAIESGQLPGDILDDIPCKYVDGKLV